MADLSELARKYQERFADSIEILPSFRGETSWRVALPSLLPIMRALKEDDGFDFLVDLSSVDNFGQDPRFEIVYELFSYQTLHHLRIKTRVSEDAEGVPSVTSIWRTANWHEREVFDMMGIRFTGHPDLRRILMWDGYPFHPLRKDFPLEGKETELPDIAFTRPAPLEGGPFVTAPADLTIDREPRARPPEP
ncbi:MAG: NADH-quinone oxidoreductase subunit C [Verrucomicrobiia bacterium]